MSRLPVVKTGKLWIGGKWPRSESGATFIVQNKKLMGQVGVVFSLVLVQVIAC